MNDEYHPIYPEIEPIIIGEKKYYNVSKKKKQHKYLQNRRWPDGSNQSGNIESVTSHRNSRNPKLIVKLFRLFNGVCHYCKRKITINEATKDHKIPLSKGGTNSKDNLLLSCWKCNNKKGNMNYEDFINLIR